MARNNPPEQPLSASPGSLSASPASPPLAPALAAAADTSSLDVTTVLREATAALRWAAWTGADSVAWERAPVPARAPRQATPAAPQPTERPALRERRPARPKRDTVPTAQAPGATDLPSQAQAPSAHGARARPPATSGPAPSAPGAADQRARLAALHARVGPCQRCELHRARRSVVHGVGDPDARLLVVGAGPYDDEDGAGTPFAGEDGALLDRMLAAMGLRREEVFLTGLVRCRVPGTRGATHPAVPSAALSSCTPFLRTELQIVQPEAVLLLGDDPAQFLLRSAGVAVSRGRWHALLNIPTRATWGLSTMRLQTSRKREAWEDLQAVMAKLGLRR